MVSNSYPESKTTGLLYRAKYRHGSTHTWTHSYKIWRYNLSYLPTPGGGPWRPVVEVVVGSTYPQWTGRRELLGRANILCLHLRTGQSGVYAKLINMRLNVYILLCILYRERLYGKLTQLYRGTSML